VTLFTFERKGPFEWKLVHIGLPDGVSPVAAPVATAPQGGLAKGRESGQP
jgi:hypothetical protein